MKAIFLIQKSGFLSHDQQWIRKRHIFSAQGEYQGESTNANNLISWLDKEKCLSVSADTVAVKQIRQNGYRGLVADRLLEPEKTIFSLPLHMAIMQNMQNTELPWSVDMGMQLLKIKHNLSSSNQSGSISRMAWIDSLPKEVKLPSLHFSDEEILQFDYEDMVQEIYVIKEMHKQSYEQLRPELQKMGFGWEDFAWACSVMLSRCFVFGEDERHISVPGIDMCNHSFGATAGVRMIHNPEQCQGQDATLDIAPPSTLYSPASYFQLHTGERPLKSGREISICYGEWPNDAFVLFFGFVPDYNPYDWFVLFYTFRDMLEFVLWLATKKKFQVDEVGTKIVEEIISIIAQGQQKEEEVLGIDGQLRLRLSRLFVYQNGMDDCLILNIRKIGQYWNIIKNVLHTNSFQDVRSPSLGEILTERCRQKLEGFSTSLEEDMSLLQRTELSINSRIAVQFRVSKKQVLLSALRNLNENNV